MREKEKVRMMIVILTPVIVIIQRKRLLLVIAITCCVVGNLWYVAEFPRLLHDYHASLSTSSSSSSLSSKSAMSSSSVLSPSVLDVYPNLKWEHHRYSQLPPSQQPQQNDLLVLGNPRRLQHNQNMSTNESIRQQQQQPSNITNVNTSQLLRGGEQYQKEKTTNNQRISSQIMAQHQPNLQQPFASSTATTATSSTSSYHQQQPRRRRSLLIAQYAGTSPNNRALLNLTKSVTQAYAQRYHYDYVLCQGIAFPQRGGILRQVIPTIDSRVTYNKVAILEYALQQQQQQQQKLRQPKQQQQQQQQQQQMYDYVLILDVDAMMYGFDYDILDELPSSLDDYLFVAHKTGATRTATTTTRTTTSRSTSTLQDPRQVINNSTSKQGTSTSTPLGIRSSSTSSSTSFNIGVSLWNLRHPFIQQFIKQWKYYILWDIRFSFTCKTDQSALRYVLDSIPGFQIDKHVLLMKQNEFGYGSGRLVRHFIPSRRNQQQVSLLSTTTSSKTYGSGSNHTSSHNTAGNNTTSSRLGQVTKNRILDSRLVAAMNSVAEICQLDPTLESICGGSIDE